MRIKKVLICGLGALGLTYANKLKDICTLKILADDERINKFKKNPPILNGSEIYLEYILPTEDWNPDLIIISTKSTGLDSALSYIKNFVSENTIIISLINGISSETQIQKTYPKAQVLRSYFIGHSAIGVNIDETMQYFQDGVGKIVLEPCSILEDFFSKNNIDYEVSKDIIYSQWLKLGVNIILNEPSAIYKCTVGELRKRKDYIPLALGLLEEVKQIAQKNGLNNLDNYVEEVLESANLISDDGKTSMYQDVLAKKKTEVDIFSGEIIKLGKIYGIKTPINENIYNKIKNIERSFS